MHFSTLLALAPLMGAALAAPQAEPAQLMRRQHPSKPCSHLTGGLHLIAAGGANTNNQKDYGLIYSLAQAILQEIPGSTNVSLPYNKVLAPTSPGQPAKLQPGAIAGGMSTLHQYIIDYHHDCPKTKIALIGYSSGGVITMNDLCQVNSQTQIPAALSGNTVVGGVMYGEETRTPGAQWNQGSCTSYGGTAPRANPNGCYPFGNNLQSYCDNGDPDCCVGSGDDLQVHFSYPAKYDKLAAGFIADRFRAAGGA